MQQRTGNITLIQYRCPGGLTGIDDPIHPDGMDKHQDSHTITVSYRGTVGREGIVVICELHERYCEPTGKIAYAPTSEVSQVRQRWATE